MKKLLLFFACFLFLALTSAFSQSILKQNIYFKSDDYSLDVLSKTTLQSMKDELKKFKEVSIEIVGHTDQDGSQAYNLDLSKKRAEEVKKFFEQIELSVPNIHVSFLGETDLVFQSLDDDSKKQNRRVTIEAVGYNYSNVHEMVTQVELEDNDSHTIDQRMESIIELKKGTEVNIPIHAFCHMDGTPLESQKVDLLFKEAFSYADMVDERLFTQTEDQWLETGGMIYIEASQNGVPLKLQDGKSIALLFPEQEMKDGMELFTGNEDEDGIIWDETGEKIAGVKSDKNLPFLKVDLSPILDLELKDNDLLPLSFAPMPPYPHPVKMPNPPYHENYTEEGYLKAVQKYEDALAAYEKDKVDRPELLKSWKAEAERRKDIVIEHKRNYMRSKVEDKLKERINRLRIDQDRISHEKLISVLFKFLDKGVGKIDYNDWHYTKLAFGQYVVQARKEIGLDFPDYKYMIGSGFFPEFAGARTQVLNNIADRKYELGYIDKSTLMRYAVNTSQLGWINCDRFYELSEDAKTDLEFASLTEGDQFYLIFKKRKSLIRPRMSNGKVFFRGVPKGEDVRMVAISMNEGNARMAKIDFTIDTNKGVKLVYAPANLKELRTALDI